MPKQIMVFLNSPHVQSALVDVPEETQLVDWVQATKAKDYFISQDEKIWLYNSICGAELIETVVTTTAVQAMQAMESNARKLHNQR